MNRLNEPPHQLDSLDLIGVWLIVWRHKWFVASCTAACVGAALVYVFTATSWYRADVLLKPADNRSAQGLASALGGLGGLGGLAGLTGLNLGSSNSAAEPMAVLTSRELTAAFIEEQKLLPVLFSEKWDFSAGRWKTSDLTKQPDIRDGVKYFNERVRDVRDDRKTGFVVVSVEWTDPKIAAEWANLLVDRVNKRMRDRALIEAESNVAYLKQELAASTVVALQQTIGRVLESELQKLMLAKGNKEYAFKTLDSAEIPKWRVKPQRSLIVATAFAFGLITSTLFLVARRFVRQKHVLDQ